MTSWTVAYLVPLSMGFSRQEYWSGLPFPSPGESSQNKDQTRVSSIGTLPLNHQGSQSLWYFLLRWNRPGCRWCKAKFGFGDRPGEAGPTQYGFFLPVLQPEQAQYRPSLGPKTRKCSTEMKGESSPPLYFILCHSTLSPSFLTSEFLLL